MRWSEGEAEVKLDFNCNVYEANWRVEKRPWLVFERYGVAVVVVVVVG